MPHMPASQALSRFRVLDLTQVRAGPTCARQLADWGADVVQIQMPDTMRGDDTLGGQDGSDYQYTHRNKRSITLNLKEPQGIEVLKKLVEKADVLLENFRPDVKNRLGIDYETLSKINPRLVYASISGFGQTGPYAGRPGFDQIAQGMGGLMSVTGIPGHGPLRVGIPIADLTGGIFAAYGVTVALLEREASGKGQWVQTSLLQAMIYMMDFQTSRYTMEGIVPKQAGNFHPTSMPTGVYKTKDGHVNLAVFGGKIWERFCEAIGAPEWIKDERSVNKSARHVNRDWLNAEIEKHLARETSAYWVKTFNDAGVACGEINDIGQALEHEQVKHLGMVQEVESPRLGKLRLVGQPIIMSRTPSKIVRSTPKRGEHNEEILAEAGYSADQIKRLKEEGVY
jgi:crotonobetainyl-CoA:carnitine CoA-transferase CaiB-like acyl-CoA transferase